MNRHLFHAVGNCCILCGVGLRESDETDDERWALCPGGADTNLRAISHRIAERKLAARMQYERPFRCPPA
jgi:hypothetical protein